MVSFVEIIKRLMEGDYSTSTGHPNAPEEFEEFVREVKRRVPELRDKEDWEVESTVLDAIEWAINTSCKLVSDYNIGRGNYYQTVELYECTHPEVGRFYLLRGIEEDGDAGYGYYGFFLTRDRKRAEESYEEEVRHIKEELEELGVAPEEVE